MEKKGVLVGAAIVVLKDGKVLLGKRADANVGGGYWCFPGGKVEPGERAEQAAERELLEESGLKALGLQFMGFADLPFNPQPWVTLVFKCRSFSGSVEAREPDKIGEWNWFSKNEIPSPLFKHTAEAFEKNLVWD